MFHGMDVPFLLIYLSVDEHLGCSYFGAMNNVHTFGAMYAFLSLGYISRSRFTGS